MVRLLVAEGAEVDLQNSFGYSALHWAACEGHVAEARALLAAGANVDVDSEVIMEDIERGTPLRLAAGHGSVEMVRLLLGAGATVDWTDDWWVTPLMAAANCGHTLVLLALLAAGASLEAAWQGHTALTLAAQNGHDASVAALLAAGTAVDGSAEGPTPLTLAAAGDHAAVVARLLAAGASYGPGPLPGLERALLPVWETAPHRLPDLAQHMEPEALERVRAALAALCLRTPLRQPELYMRVVGLAFQE